MMMRNNRKKRQSGFTLIEIMISMVVFMVAVVGMVAMQRASIAATQHAKQRTAANNIARFVTTQLKTEISNWRKYTIDDALDSKSGFPLLNASLSTKGSWVSFGNNLRVDEFLGHSGLGSGASARFCVNYMVEPVCDVDPVCIDAAKTPPTNQHVWWVRVRVTWTKEGDFDNNWTQCSPDVVATRLDKFQDHAVELVTMASREFAR